MVRAILNGNKTVTRRVMKLQPDTDADITVERYHVSITNRQGFQEPGAEIFGAWWREGEGGCKCPYGQPGDRLWVRETTEVDEQSSQVVRLARYAADRQPVIYRHPEGDEYDGAVAHWDYPRRSRPSIHMPRWACRILLEITDVRVERLQAGEGETASESRYVAEGIHRIHHGDGDYYFHPFKSEPGPGNWIDPFDAWRELWVSINGADSWNSNPWVWVVEFKQVTP
jgi:hypothetical protein